MSQFTNSLINESSPYLLQHAHNLVEWMPWSDETLQKAQNENKLILVSIGYSACHWCHVMEKESFMDEEVADLMNQHFICIKVDREERPDIDQIYMEAVQTIQRSAGWPLNCFALPDGKPFWGGTYFKKEQWMSILNQLAELYKEQPEKIKSQADEITDIIKREPLIQIETDQNSLILESDIKSIYSNLSINFDLSNGGHAGSPKFPMPVMIEYLLRYYHFSKDPETLYYINLTLEKMADGGIYDQLEGGFSRYSVDNQWIVPHFEKMLYDNAQLITVYSETYLLTGNKRFKQVVEQTVQFVLDNLTSQEGLFFSALDADSEGIEGKYYTWKTEELKSILGDDFDIFTDYFSITDEGNWENNQNILYRSVAGEKIAEKHNITENQLQNIINKAINSLNDIRNGRPRPSLDNKIILSWNALVIKALTKAYIAVGNDSYLETAVIATEKILSGMKNDDGGLYRIHKNGKSSVSGFLDDYAFLVEALISLHQVTMNYKWIQIAEDLLLYTRKCFFNASSSLFYYSKPNKELIARKHEITDQVIPSSNSSIARSFFHLGMLLHNNEYIEMSDKMLKAIWGKAREYPSGFYNWLILGLERISDFRIIAVTGKNMLSKVEEINNYFYPFKIITGAEAAVDRPHLELRYVEGETMIYVCDLNSCQRPVTEVQDAMKYFKKETNHQKST